MNKPTIIATTNATIEPTGTFLQSFEVIELLEFEGFGATKTSGEKCDFQQKIMLETFCW